MNTQVIATTSLLGLLIATAAIAADIYKWTDADGNVHYGDRPIGQQSERVPIVSRPTDPARIQALSQARADARAQAAEEAAALAAEGPTEEELRAEARERAEKCSSYRERLQRFVTSRRLYREDENGERVYLDEEEMQAARQRVEDQVADYCNS
jgi:hypothetical protein